MSNLMKLDTDSESMRSSLECLSSHLVYESAMAPIELSENDENYIIEEDDGESYIFKLNTGEKFMPSLYSYFIKKIESLKKLKKTRKRKGKVIVREKSKLIRSV